MTTLKAPFPYFGGKRAVAPLVWQRLGDVRNYIEPFFGSGAVLLNRPHPPKVETVNDIDCMIANFWRATQRDPEAVVHHCDWPVNEADLHARHRWLVLSQEAADFRKRMRTDPDHYDAKVAGWWVWGICIWIGGGWCTMSDGPGRRPALSNAGAGINSDIKGPVKKKPDFRSNGVHRKRPSVGGLLEWFEALRGRLRSVRVCCGDWKRVCGSRSTTTRHGVTGIFLDPPYAGEIDGTKSRDGAIYSSDDLAVSAEVGAFCTEEIELSNGQRGPRCDDPKLRIVICGLEGEHKELEAHGFTKLSWRTQGGYGNRGAANDNRHRERLWFSPHCVELDLFERLLGDALSGYTRNT